MYPVIPSALLTPSKTQHVRQMAVLTHNVPYTQAEYLIIELFSVSSDGFIIVNSLGLVFILNKILEDQF